MNWAMNNLAYSASHFVNLYNEMNEYIVSFICRGQVDAFMSTNLVSLSLSFPPIDGSQLHFC